MGFGEGKRGAYPSMADFDVEVLACAVSRAGAARGAGIGAHRSDSWMQVTVSQVSKPASVNFAVYCDRPSLSKVELREVIGTKVWVDKVRRGWLRTRREGERVEKGL